MEISSKYLCLGPFLRDPATAVWRWGTGKIFKALRVTLMHNEG